MLYLFPFLVIYTKSENSEIQAKDEDEMNSLNQHFVILGLFYSGFSAISIKATKEAVFFSFAWHMEILHNQGIGNKGMPQSENIEMNALKVVLSLIGKDPCQR